MRVDLKLVRAVREIVRVVKHNSVSGQNRTGIEQDQLVQPERINIRRRHISDVCIRVQPSNQADRVRFQVPPRRGVICAVVVVLFRDQIFVAITPLANPV